jgi:hypothetical protein
MLTIIRFLDLWLDHRLLARRPVRDWRRKRLVRRRLIWWRSESQAGVEVPQAIWLPSICFTPDYGPPRRCLGNMGLRPQLLRPPPLGLCPGAHLHPHIALFSRQVPSSSLIIYSNVEIVLTNSH